MTVHPRFSIDIVPGRGRVLVTPRGELDLATSADVWDELAELRKAGFERIVLDLRELSFIDSAGLRLIVRARDASARDGFEFSLIDGREDVCRVLDVTGLREHLRLTRP